MTITATSSMAIALSGIVDLLAQSTVFQNRMAAWHDEAASEANARLHIFGFDQYNPADDSNIVRPFAVVGTTRHVWDAICQGSVIQYLPTGTVLVILVDDARYADCFRDNAVDGQLDSYMDALNWMGGIFDGWSGSVGTGAGFPIPHIEPVVEPSRPDVTARESDDFWISMWACNYGEEAAG